MFFFFAPRTTVFPLPPPFNRVCTKQLDPVHFEYDFFLRGYNLWPERFEFGIDIGPRANVSESSFL